MQRREFVKYLTAGTAGQFILPAASANAAAARCVALPVHMHPHRRCK